MNALVTARFDSQLGKYLERIDIDNVALNQYAQAIGIEKAIGYKARQQGKKAEPVSINFHAGFCVESIAGASALVAGHYNLRPTQYGAMPPADIDIFVGSEVLVLGATEQETHCEREKQLDSNISTSIQEELIHAADPALFGRDYTDLLVSGKDPELKTLHKDLYSFEFKAGVGGAIALMNSIVGSSIAYALIDGAEMPYAKEVAIAGAVATFAGIGAASWKLVCGGDFKKLINLETQIANHLYISSPHEVHAKSIAKAHGPQEFISSSVSSFARRNLSRSKEKRQTGKRKSPDKQTKLQEV